MWAVHRVCCVHARRAAGRGSRRARRRHRPAGVARAAHARGRRRPAGCRRRDVSAGRGRATRCRAARDALRRLERQSAGHLGGSPARESPPLRPVRHRPQGRRRVRHAGSRRRRPGAADRVGRLHRCAAVHVRDLARGEQGRRIGRGRHTRRGSALRTGDRWLRPRDRRDRAPRRSARDADGRHRRCVRERRQPRGRHRRRRRRRGVPARRDARRQPQPGVGVAGRAADRCAVQAAVPAVRRADRAGRSRPPRPIRRRRS